MEFDILVLSEIWLFGEKNLKLKNFDTVKCNRFNKRGGGVAVLVRHGFKYRDVKYEIHLYSIMFYYNIFV